MTTVTLLRSRTGRLLVSTHLGPPCGVTASHGGHPSSDRARGEEGANQRHLVKGKLISGRKSAQVTHQGDGTALVAPFLRP